MERTWLSKTPSTALSRELASALGIRPAVAQVLINRGIRTIETARAFLDHPRTAPSSPLSLPGIPEAVDRLSQAVRAKEKIVVYGDYDTDGITATAIILSAVRSAGGDAGFYLPDRIQEGYGLHTGVVERLSAEGCRLLVTVDCGATAVAEALRARELGMDLIIVDHHELGSDGSLPVSVAHINPHRADGGPGDAPPCGAGLALHLASLFLSAQGMAREIPSLLDLAGVGTVADIVPLQGFNRWLVAEALVLLNRNARPGFHALRDAAGLGQRRLEAMHIGYALAPRINAGGRIGDPALGLKLMLSPTYEAAQPFAQQLDDENRRRQQLERQALDEALRQVEPYLEGKFRKAIVAVSDSWHPGVIGLVSSRLTERFTRPSVVVTFSHGAGKGSARSVQGFHLTRALQACAGTLVQYGGHAMAAGITVDRERIGGFESEFLAEAERSVPDGALIPRLSVDAELFLEDVDEELCRQLSLLEPFGEGNEDPLFGVKGAMVIGQPRQVGGDKHLKFMVRSKERNFEAIAFGAGSRLTQLSSSVLVDIVFVPQINRWQDQETVQLRVEDFRRTK